MNVGMKAIMLGIYGLFWGSYRNFKVHKQFKLDIENALLLEEWNLCPMSPCIYPRHVLEWGWDTAKFWTA